MHNSEFILVFFLLHLLGRWSYTGIDVFSVNSLIEFSLKGMDTKVQINRINSDIPTKSKQLI